MKNKIKREKLLKKIFQKKQKNNLYKLQIPFNIWHRQTILAEANKNANIIQNQFRLNQLKHLLSKIIDAGNNKILNTNRKNILNNLLEKKSYIDDKSALISINGDNIIPILIIVLLK